MEQLSLFFGILVSRRVEIDLVAFQMEFKCIQIPVIIANRSVCFSFNLAMSDGL